MTETQHQFIELVTREIDDLDQEIERLINDGNTVLAEVLVHRRDIVVHNYMRLRS